MPNNSKNIKIVVDILIMLIGIALKLCKVISWSWWWVLSPIWLPVVVYILWLCAIYDAESKERLRRK